jgi:hypothetical protein
MKLRGWILLLLLLTTTFGRAERLRDRKSILGSMEKAAAKDIPLRVHVVVALCDNLHQGIVPVSAKLGNGQDPDNNLYWGALYGVRSHFKKTGWKLVEKTKPGGEILEKVIFKKRIARREVILQAEAFRGDKIKSAMERFLMFASGNFGDGSRHIDLVAFVGHNGLMDVELDSFPDWKAESGRRDVIILACQGRAYWQKPIEKAGAYPLIWSTGLMAAEAYPLAAALEGWARGEKAPAIRERAAGAYAKFQKNCGKDAARRLLVTGWSQKGQ